MNTPIDERPASGNAPHQTTKWIEVIRGEFLEMPCLRLTLPQARGLWGLDEPTCSASLEQLTASGFLRRNADRYCRNGTA